MNSIYILTLKERLLLPTVLPRENNYTGLMIQQRIIDKVTLTSDQVKKYAVEVNSAGINWNTAGDNATFQIEFTDKEQELIGTVLLQLDAKSKLTFDLLPLYRKFLMP